MKPLASMDREGEEGSGPRRPAQRQESHPERVCPICGATLLERKCKLLCPDPACGYYMSCSDFY
jgi:hypothetical protein